MTPEPQTQDELDALVKEVMPILRRAGLATTPEARERHEANLPGAMYELRIEWAASPLLDGREVSFIEYLAARLPRRLRHIDEEQQPDLYDSNRRYFTDPGFTKPDPRAVVPLDDADVRVTDPEPDQRSDVERLVAALNEARIEAATQPVAFALLAGVAAGSVVNGRHAGALLGVSRATGALHAAEALIEQRTFKL